MNLIQDIRLYPEHPDFHGEDFCVMKDILQRLLFLLRWEGFGFGEFDHLYMNYTPSLPHGEVRLSDRPVDRYHTWLRYVDAGCDPQVFHDAQREERRQFLSATIRDAVRLHADGDHRGIFDRCYDQVMTFGSELEIPYKEKSGEHLSVRIGTTISNDGNFHPIIRIFDGSGQLLRKEDLPACDREKFLGQFGTISLGKRSVRIEPRKSQWLNPGKNTPIKLTV